MLKDSFIVMPICQKVTIKVFFYTFQTAVSPLKSYVYNMAWPVCVICNI